MKKDIIFSLPVEAVEGATEVVVLGDFNNWTPEKKFVLKKQQDGSFKTIVQLEAGKTYQYRFLLNDGRWVNDYNAQNYVPASDFFIDNCVITVPETVDIEVNQKPKVAKKKETVKAKAAVKTVSGETKVKKAAAPKAKKVATSGEKATAKKVAKPAKAVKKETIQTKK
ncbi:MAG: isoamylase early set domain-containing protein [Ginsengibacter sp.]